MCKMGRCGLDIVSLSSVYGTGSGMKFLDWGWLLCYTGDRIVGILFSLKLKTVQLKFFPRGRTSIGFNK